MGVAAVDGDPANVRRTDTANAPCQRSNELAGQAAKPKGAAAIRSSADLAVVSLLTRVTDATQLYAVRVYARFCVTHPSHPRELSRRAVSGALRLIKPLISSTLR